jgi:peptidyl-dipeptidase A
MIRHVGMAPSDVEPLREGLRETARTRQLLFPRWVLVMVHFERALYRDPSADVNRLWWDLVERYQGVSRLEGRDAPDWACKIHLAVAPVYYHNYLLGDLMASQIQALLDGKGDAPRWFDGAGSGTVLRERLFRDGARYDWNETLRRLTGEPLDPRHYVAQFVATS